MAVVWHRVLQQDKSKILDFITFFENELLDARQELKVVGTIEKIAAKLPGIFEYRFGQLQAIEAVLEQFENEMRKLRAEQFRLFLETYCRQLTSSDAWKYVDGVDIVADLAELINEVAYIRNQYISVTKALDQLSYMLGHITKLRSVGLETAEIGRTSF